MLNYMKAEMYKVFQRKATRNFMIVMLLGEILLVGSMAFANTRNVDVSASSGMSILVNMLTIGLYGGLLIADFVFSDQYKTGTLKNEVSFGISRNRIYLGKLLVACITAIILSAIMLAAYLGLCYVALPHHGQELDAISAVGYCLLGALPLWLGGMALTIMLFFICKSETIGSLLTILSYIGLAGILYLLSVIVNQNFMMLYDVTLTVPLGDMGAHIGDWDWLLRCWLIGAGWFAGTAVIGMAFFRKREIS